MNHKYFMTQALKEALKAYRKNEVPIGALITYENKIIARAHNIKESTQDPTTHAEIIAIKKASKYLQSWRLNNCNIYVTLEPCMMCAGAIYQSRIKNLYFSTPDKKAGVIISNGNYLDNKWLNHKVNYNWGIKKNTSSKLLKRFFKKLRN